MRKAIDVGELAFSEDGEETVYGRKTQVYSMVFPKHSAKDYDCLPNLDARLTDADFDPKNPEYHF